MAVVPGNPCKLVGGFVGTLEDADTLVVAYACLCENYSLS